MEKQQLIATVTKAKSGDQEALSLLFNEYYNDIYYFALKTVKDAELASDITQEAFVDIIKHIDSLKEPVAFVSWAKQITYHQCTRYFKKQKDVIVDEDEDGNTVFDDLKEENAEFIPDEALDRDDFKQTILSIIDTLSPEQRSAVMMYYFDEMSVAEIAEVQGVSEGTVKSRLNYARKAIKAAVEDYENKNNIKLHAIPFFPFLRFVFSSDKQSTSVASTSFQTVASKAASSSASTTANSGSAVAAKSAKNKIIAAVLAGVIALGAIGAALAIKNRNSSSSGAGSDNTSDAYVYSSYDEIRTEVLSVVEQREPDEITEATVIDGVKYRYNVSDSAYNLLEYDNDFDIAIIKEFVSGVDAVYDGDMVYLVLQYKIPCDSEDEVKALMNRDIERASEIMKEVYNGNTISPDYKPTVSESDLDDAVYGLHTVVFTFSEQIIVDVAVIGEVENPASTVEFKFTGLLEDDQLYYYPKIVFAFDTRTSGKWTCGITSGLTGMIY